MAITGELVFNDVGSSEDYLYQEVLDDFKNAKNIYIATFGLGWKMDLIEKIAECEDSEITLIADLSTYNKNAKEKIKLINDVFDKFSAKCSKNINLFFNKDNHVKIVGTDNIMYFGSQNYTVASKSNYEMGIIIKDKDGIAQVLEKFNIIKSASIRWQDIYRELYEFFCINIVIIEKLICELEILCEEVGDYEVEDEIQELECYREFIKKIDSYLECREIPLFDRILEKQDELESIWKSLDYSKYLGALCNELYKNDGIDAELYEIEYILKSLLERIKEVRDILKSRRGLGNTDNRFEIYEMFGISKKEIDEVLICKNLTH